MDIVDVQVMYGKNPLFGLDISLDSMRGYVLSDPRHEMRVVAVAAAPETNYSIADVVAENPDVFLGAYLVIVQKDLSFNGVRIAKTRVDELRSLALRDEVKGFKLHTTIPRVSIDDPVHLPYFALAAEVDKPVLVHCSSSGLEYTSPEKNRNLLERLSKDEIFADVILAHMGGFSQEMLPGNLSLARDFGNVFYTTTGITGEIHRYETHTGQVGESRWVEGSIRSLAEQVLLDSLSHPVLSDRVLFGSDFGVLMPDLQVLDAIGVYHAEKMMKNARRLFRLDKI